VKVLRLCWLGEPTGDYLEMVRFFRDALHVRIASEERTGDEPAAEGAEPVQVFAPGDPTFTFLGEFPVGPVALFEVDDLQTARLELLAAGVELTGDVERDATWEWLNFRAPDGNLYELASRIRHEDDTDV
jgi:hypothetical protein